MILSFSHFYRAMYSFWTETLGEELGLYKRPSDKMGQLSMEALRSCRLVVDTGMHAMGWSMEQALEYMLENTAMGKHDAATEVTRYVTWPGQATAYKVGERFLRKLRTNAETKLADKFDPRDLYHVILSCGPVPLGVLENLVDEYIQGVLSSRVNIPASEGTEPDTPAFVEAMTFANWCKCCVVPGTCQV